MPRAKRQHFALPLYQTPAVYRVLQPNVGTMPKSKPRNEYIEESITEYSITDSALEYRHFMLSADDIDGLGLSYVGDYRWAQLVSFHQLNFTRA